MTPFWILDSLMTLMLIFLALALILTAIFIKKWIAGRKGFLEAFEKNWRLLVAALLCCIIGWLIGQNGLIEIEKSLRFLEGLK